MKKTLLITSLAAAMSVTTATNAAFTPMGDGDYVMTITGGCFNFGNCQAAGDKALTDNVTENEASAANFGNPAGSGIINDGLMGVVEFSLVSGNISVTSYSQDSYLATAGGTFYLRSTDLNTMGGTIDGAGNIIFDTTGRRGLAAAFVNTLGEQEWNRDDTSDGLGTGAFDLFTTGDSSNRQQGFAGGFTVTGTALQDTANVNERSGTIVNAGNIGQAWGSSFDNTQYAEIWDIKVSLIAGLPSAVDDDLSTALSTTLNVNIDDFLIIPNDTHADTNEALTFVSFDDALTDPGSSVSEAGGVITYVPNPAFTDPSNDSFTYTITDGAGEQSTATVNIIITDAPPPLANADDVATTEDIPLTLDPVRATLSVPGVVVDTDPDPLETPNLAISAFDGFSANSGTISRAPGTNELTYTPAVDFFGTDTFNYTIQNSAPLSASTTVTVTVAGVNDAPACTDVAFNTAIDAPLLIDVDGELVSTTSMPPLCVDADGDAVSLATFDTVGTNGGIISDDGAGTLTYTPPAGFEGIDTFTFTATDGVDNATPNTATVNVLNATLSNFTMLEASGSTFGGTNDVVIDWDETTFNSIVLDTNGTPTVIDPVADFEIFKLVSTHPFFSFTWRAHHIRIFKNTTASALTLNIDVTCTASDYDAGIVDCDKPLSEQQATQRFISVTLQPGEIASHILFDWGSSQPTSCGQNSCDIDVINVWKENAQWDTHGDAAPKNALWLGAAGFAPALDATWRLASADANADGINGTPMIDGAFIGFYANFNYKPSGTGEALPPYEDNISDVETSGFSMGLWSLLLGLVSLIGLRRSNNKK